MKLVYMVASVGVAMLLSATFQSHTACNRILRAMPVPGWQLHVVIDHSATARQAGACCTNTIAFPSTTLYQTLETWGGWKPQLLSVD